MTHFHRKFSVALVSLSVFCGIVGDGLAGEQKDRIKTIRVPGDSKVMKAQIDGIGTIHLLLDAEDGPKYVKSTDAGATFSAPIAIVDAASKKPGLKFQS